MIFEVIPWTKSDSPSIDIEQAKKLPLSLKKIIHTVVRRSRILL